MIALSGHEIWMGRHSNLGPIDPQFGSQPARLVLSEFDEALEKVKQDPASINVWRPILEQIPPTYLSACEHAIDWSIEIATRTLADGMFKDRADALDFSKEIAEGLADFSKSKSHSRHFHREDCEELGLKITSLESSQEMQDAVLSVHHACMISLMDTPAAKLIENDRGILYGKMIGSA